MEKIISAYLWAWRNYESGHRSLKKLRQFYPDAGIFINVDYEGDIENYKRISDEMGGTFSRNNFQVGYCGDCLAAVVGRECWPKENAFEWIRGLYEACLKADTEYMLILEEDDFILKPLTILEYDFAMAIHPTAPSPAGVYRPNYLPPEFMEYSKRLGGIDYAPGYGAGGGCIFKPRYFVKAWEKCKDVLWEDYDKLVPINKIMGWQDFIVQFVMMIGGYEIVQNPYEAQPWEISNWKDYEIVCGLKDHTLVEL